MNLRKIAIFSKYENNNAIQECKSELPSEESSEQSNFGYQEDKELMIKIKSSIIKLEEYSNMSKSELSNSQMDYNSYFTESNDKNSEEAIDLIKKMTFGTKQKKSKYLNTEIMDQFKKITNESSSQKSSNPNSEAPVNNFTKDDSINKNRKKSSSSKQDDSLSVKHNSQQSPLNKCAIIKQHDSSDFKHKSFTKSKRNKILQKQSTNPDLKDDSPKKVKRKKRTHKQSTSPDLKDESPKKSRRKKTMPKKCDIPGFKDESPTKVKRMTAMQKKADSPVLNVPKRNHRLNKPDDSPGSKLESPQSKRKQILNKPDDSPSFKLESPQSKRKQILNKSDDSPTIKIDPQKSKKKIRISKPVDKQKKSNVKVKQHNKSLLNKPKIIIKEVQVDDKEKLDANNEQNDEMLGLINEYDEQIPSQFYIEKHSSKESINSNNLTIGANYELRGTENNSIESSVHSMKKELDANQRLEVQPDVLLARVGIMNLNNYSPSIDKHGTPNNSFSQDSDEESEFNLKTDTPEKSNVLNKIITDEESDFNLKSDTLEKSNVPNKSKIITDNSKKSKTPKDPSKNEEVKDPSKNEEVKSNKDTKGFSFFVKPLSGIKPSNDTPHSSSKEPTLLSVEDVQKEMKYKSKQVDIELAAAANYQKRILAMEELRKKQAIIDAENLRKKQEEEQIEQKKKEDEQKLQDSIDTTNVGKIFFKSLEPKKKKGNVLNVKKAEPIKTTIFTKTAMEQAADFENNFLDVDKKENTDDKVIEKKFNSKSPVRRGGLQIFSKTIKRAWAKGIKNAAGDISPTRKKKKKKKVEKVDEKPRFPEIKYFTDKSMKFAFGELDTEYNAFEDTRFEHLDNLEVDHDSQKNLDSDNEKNGKNKFQKKAPVPIFKNTKIIDKEKVDKVALKKKKPQLFFLSYNDISSKIIWEYCLVSSPDAQKHTRLHAKRFKDFDMNLFSGGIRKRMKPDALLTFWSQEHFDYITALLDYMLINEKKFIVMDCSKKDVTLVKKFPKNYYDINFIVNQTLPPPSYIADKFFVSKEERSRRSQMLGTSTSFSKNSRNMMGFNIKGLEALTKKYTTSQIKAFDTSGPGEKLQGVIFSRKYMDKAIVEEDFDESAESVIETKISPKNRNTEKKSRSNSLFRIKNNEPVITQEITNNKTIETKNQNIKTVTKLSNFNINGSFENLSKRNASAIDCLSLQPGIPLSRNFIHRPNNISEMSDKLPSEKSNILTPVDRKSMPYSFSNDPKVKVDTEETKEQLGETKQQFGEIDMKLVGRKRPTQLQPIDNSDLSENSNSIQGSDSSNCIINKAFDKGSIFWYPIEYKENDYWLEIEKIIEINKKALVEHEKKRDILDDKTEKNITNSIIDINLHADISGYNVFQGKLDNGSICGILSIIAEKYKRLIKRIVKTSDPEHPDFVQVWLFHNGTWKSQLLDSKFPIEVTTPNDKFNNPGPPNLQYSSPLPKLVGGKNKGTWMMYLEKAFARLYGGYKNLSNVDPVIIMNEITGSPVRMYTVKEDKKVLWKQLQADFRNSNSIICIHTKKADQMNVDRCYMLPNYTYNIKDLMNWDLLDKTKRFILCHDPLVTKRFKKFGKTYKKQVYNKLLTDGVTKQDLVRKNQFWMKWEDILENCRSISVTLIHVAYKYSSLEVPYNDRTFNRPAQYFLIKLKAPKDSLGYITFHKNIKRNFIIEEDIESTKKEEADEESKLKKEASLTDINLKEKPKSNEKKPQQEKDNKQLPIIAKENLKPASNDKKVPQDKEVKPKNDSSDFYRITRIMIYEIKDHKLNELSPIGMKTGFDTRLSTYFKNSQEEFYAYLEIEYDPYNAYYFTLSSYASNPVYMQLFKESTELINTDNNRYDLLLALLCSYAQGYTNFKENHIYKFTNSAYLFKNKVLEERIWNNRKKSCEFCKRYFGEIFGYYAYIYFNNSSKRFIDEYYPERMFNIEFSYPFQVENIALVNKYDKVFIEVPPWTVGFTLLKYGKLMHQKTNVVINTTQLWR